MKKFILIFFSALIFISCKNQKAEEKVQNGVVSNVVVLTDSQINNAHIEIGKIEPRQISTLLKVNGRIDVPPQNLVSVSVPLGGYLKSTKLLPGIPVIKNSVIAVMEDNQYIQLQQDYLTAKVQYRFFETEYNRQKALNASKASSDKIFEQSKSNYQSQRILLRSLEEKLKLIRINPAKLNENYISKSINIYSPINGFVSKVNVNIGKYVTPSEVLFELVNPTDIHLNLKIFEKDLNKIFIGQKVIAYTNNAPAKKYNGEVILISKDISNNGSTEVHCHFENYDTTLYPGMYMNAEIELKSNLQNSLPDDAIVGFEGKKYFFEKISGNRFEMTETQTGESENGFIEVISKDDLTGKNIVTKGAYTLLMSLKNKEEE